MRDLGYAVPSKLRKFMHTHILYADHLMFLVLKKYKIVAHMKGISVTFPRVANGLSEQYKASMIKS